MLRAKGDISEVGVIRQSVVAGIVDENYGHADILSCHDVSAFDPHDDKCKDRPIGEWIGSRRKAGKS